MDLLKGLPGFRDFYPEQWHELQYLINNMRKIAESYGYQEYEGPSVEARELIEAKSGSDLLEEIFQLKDKKNRNLLLRPEQTPTLARMLAKEQQRFKRPIRWFCIPRLFRDETVQRGREREFWQLNVDILGEKSMTADAETIAVAINICRACGLKDTQFTIKVNHRNLLNSFIQSHTDIDPQLVIPLIDKKIGFIQDEVERKLVEEGKPVHEAKELGLLYRRILTSSGEYRTTLVAESTEIAHLLETEEQITREVMMNKFLKVGLTNEIAEKLFDFTQVTGSPRDFLENIRLLNPPEQCKTSIDELEELSSYLDGFGVSEPVVFDASLARGLDYYTGIVFEGFDRSGQIVRALFGGGRYADLVQAVGGASLSGVGFGMGDSSLIELLKQHKLLPNLERSFDLYLAPIKKSSIQNVLKLADRLRKTFSVFCNPFDWKLKRHFENAEQHDVKIVLMLGPKDIEKNEISVRILSDGSQDSFNIDNDLENSIMAKLSKT